MRVIAGKAKGVKLIGLSASAETRPITDRAKEALFNIIGPDLPDTHFLDLFAGTGGVGIEAISRGCTRSVFVEYSEKPIADLRRNLEKTGFNTQGEIVQANVFAYIETTVNSFDTIFISPPQWHELWSKTVIAIDGKPEILEKDGIVIVQCDPDEHQILALMNLSVFDQRKYGNVLLTFYQAATHSEVSPIQMEHR